jgi:16S rRNA (uracil1498-N3)-methyltransferase
MRKIRIYQHGNFQAGQSTQLDKAASNHLLKVLRLKNHQVFTLFNGKGGEYTVTLEISGKAAIAHVAEHTLTDNESNLEIHLYQGISKGERMDFAVQKSVELGVSKITPVFCSHTVVNLKDDRVEKKLQHWQAIAISACEQSGRNIIPEITAPLDFKSLLAHDTSGLRILLDPLSTSTLRSLQPSNNKLSFLIGPEGGLTEEEISQATHVGYSGIRLGPRVLRTETAAIAAITSAQLLWGDLQS